jgi:hypothetical protein
MPIWFQFESSCHSQLEPFKLFFQFGFSQCPFGSDLKVELGVGFHIPRHLNLAFATEMAPSIQGWSPANMWQYCPPSMMSSLKGRGPGKSGSVGQ